MTATVLPLHPTGELREKLAKIRFVFTDLDATMLGKGGSVMVDADGNPSYAIPRVLVELKNAGVEVIPCSGRDRTMLREDCRIIGINAYVGEMGGLIMSDLHANEWQYYTADMPFDPTCGKNPHQVIEDSGVIEEILKLWPGEIEPHNDMGMKNMWREVTVALRGDVNDDKAREILASYNLALSWDDNGLISHISAPSTLIDQAPNRNRSLHIMPAGLTKGRGIDRMLEIKGGSRDEAIALGDSPADFEMASHVGMFICMENGLAHEEARVKVEQTNNAVVSNGRTVDGWVAAMNSILEAKRNA